MILDPLPSGVTAVADVRLFSDKARTEDETTAPVALVAGQWTVDTLNVPDGRWWVTVNAVKGATPYAYPLREPVDLPEDPTLVVSPEALAVSIQLPLPLTDSQREILTQAIKDAQSDVQGYLHRDALTPIEVVEKGLWAVGDEWNLTTNDEVIRIVSTEAEYDVDMTALGTFTVTYLAGIDARTGAVYEPIRRYVRAHAANSPDVTRLWRVVANPTKTIKSSSTEGQSVSYDVPTLGGGGAAGSGAPGALPVLSSLDRWKLRRVHVATTQYDPYGYGRYG